MNTYLFIILVALIGRYLLDLVSNRLNLRHLTEELPSEFTGFYDAESYRRSQAYLRDNTRFDIVHDSVTTALTLAFMVFGGFNQVDRLARAPGWTQIPTGLLFAGILVVLAKLVDLPFSAYRTFRIEEAYGFNRSTRQTFILDVLKSLLLTALIGGAVFAAIIWFFRAAGPHAWAACWAAVVLFQVLLVFAAPYVIMPIFNKFVPLEAGPLRSAIEDYARAQSFRIKGVFTMDGSKRSAKTNAFFTGFGRSRRIVLFDTLIERHPEDELLAIVAHEMGHCKLRHIAKAMTRSIAVTGLTFFLLSRFIGNPRLFAAFGMQQVSVYAGLVFFGFLYAPITMLIGIVENAISRRHEYEADRFAVRTLGTPGAVISGLKRLSVDNLSNLTPHPLKVVLEYSHPPMLERIDAIHRLK